MGLFSDLQFGVSGIFEILLWPIYAILIFLGPLFGLFY